MNLNERAREMRDFFNEKIESYDDVHEAFMTTKKALSDNLDVDVKRILDLGAGTGLELIEVFKRIPDVHVTAIDASDKMLEKLMQRDYSDKVTPICGDFFEVDFGEMYDAVISTSSLHHFTMQDKLRLYKKILMSLQDTGTFINCDKISATESEQEYLMSEYETNRDNYKHLDTPLTIENEKKLLLEVGFKCVMVLNVDKDNYRLFIAEK